MKFVVLINMNEVNSNSISYEGALELVGEFVETRRFVASSLVWEYSYSPQQYLHFLLALQRFNQKCSPASFDYGIMVLEILFVGKSGWKKELCRSKMF